LSAALLHATLPMPAPQVPYEVTVAALRSLYIELSDKLARYVSGLAVRDRMGPPRRHTAGLVAFGTAHRGARRGHGPVRGDETPGRGLVSVVAPHRMRSAVSASSVLVPRVPEGDRMQPARGRGVPVRGHQRSRPSRRRTHHLHLRGGALNREQARRHRDGSDMDALVLAPHRTGRVEPGQVFIQRRGERPVRRLPGAGDAIVRAHPLYVLALCPRSAAGRTSTAVSVDDRRRLTEAVAPDPGDVLSVDRREAA
jgi:hypothetical protein